MQIYYQMPLDELCARAIADARSFIETFPAAEVAVDTLERNSLRRTLDRMNRDAGISAHDDTDVDILTAILHRELERETVGWFAIFDGQIDPEIGAIGEAREVRDLTERGRTIDDCVRSLRRLAHIRSICRARLDAEQILMRR